MAHRCVFVCVFVCAQVRSWMCRVWHRTTGTPSPSLGVDPACPPVLPNPSHITSPLSLLCLCWRLFVLVTATDPVGITLSFIPSDTGCGHNKTHLITETLRAAGRRNGSLHLGSARSAAEPGWRESPRLSRVSKSLSSSSRGDAVTKELTLPASSKRHRREREPLHLGKKKKKSWQTN